MKKSKVEKRMKELQKELRGRHSPLAACQDLLVMSRQLPPIGQSRSALGSHSAYMCTVISLSSPHHPSLLNDSIIGLIKSDSRPLLQV